MYIIVDGFPIDVYKISRISEIKTIKEVYKQALSAYASYIKKYKDDSFSGTYYTLAARHSTTTKEDYLIYNTIIDHVDSMLKAVTNSGIILKTGTKLSYNSYNPWVNDPYADDYKDRLLKPEEIDWKVLPDSFIFYIEYEVSNFKGPRATGSGRQLWSKFYNSYTEAEEALDKILNAINVVRYETPKIEF